MRRIEVAFLNILLEVGRDQRELRIQGGGYEATNNASSYALPVKILNTNLIVDFSSLALPKSMSPSSCDYHTCRVVSTKETETH